jgi:hypothetical protein
MSQIQRLFIVAAGFAITIGLPIGLYVLLTRGRRRAMREIRQGAEVQGWRYRLRHWQGNPTAFRIDGRTHSGLSWVMTSGSTRGYDKGWSAVLGLRVPILGGEVDLAVLPRQPAHKSAGDVLLRESGHGSGAAGEALTGRAVARVAAFSGAIASGLEFFQNSRELPSGLAAFDAAYEVLVLPQQIQQSPVDAALGQRMLSWPANAIAPHSVLAWRDPFGLHIEARLPSPATWGNASYLAALAEELCARVPAPQSSAVAPTLFDRAVGWILRR